MVVSSAERWVLRQVGQWIHTLLDGDFICRKMGTSLSQTMDIHPVRSRFHPQKDGYLIGSDSGHTPCWMMISSAKRWVLCRVRHWICTLLNGDFIRNKMGIHSMCQLVIKTVQSETRFSSIKQQFHVCRLRHEDKLCLLWHTVHYDVFLFYFFYVIYKRTPPQKGNDWFSVATYPLKDAAVLSILRQWTIWFTVIFIPNTADSKHLWHYEQMPILFIPSDTKITTLRVSMSVDSETMNCQWTVWLIAIFI